MSAKCFLLDENVPLAIQTQLEQMETPIQVYAIGDGTAPDKGTPDPDILSWAEIHGCMLVTNNRATITDPSSGASRTRSPRAWHYPTSQADEYWRYPGRPVTHLRC